MKPITIITTLIVSLLFLANLFVGSVNIPFAETLAVLTGGESSHQSWHFIILQSRLPQAITALLCGACLATSGLLLQTTFHNPLAGPSILGINSGASLGAAVIMLAGGGSLSIAHFSVSNILAVVLAALIGSMLVMALLLLLSTIIKNNILLLIAGIMIGYLTSSAISLLNFFSTAEGVHSYVIWGLGNFSGVSMHMLPWFSALCAVGLIMALLMVKPLNALLLGHQYAENLGINIRLTRNLLLIVTGLLTAVTTAFCGPVAFIGLATPHIARLLLRNGNHRSLLPLTILSGSAIALLCNLLCTLPGPTGIIPLNAITPLIGAPVIIYILIKQKLF